MEFQEKPHTELTNSENPDVNGQSTHVKSLKELIDQVSGRSLSPIGEIGDSGLAENIPYPFLALVGQREIKLALLLTLVNPLVGGVLLVGARGTGKTTAVRSLVNLLPEIPRSLCYFGCLPEDIETGGIAAVCPDCARKFAMGDPLFVLDQVRLIELPLNARLEDVIGGMDEQAVSHERTHVRRDILSHADRNLLFIDEVNILTDEIIDAVLDAAAQGSYSIKRGPLSAIYRSRFVLIGSMNPEEGQLRSQIQDRFGLRVVVKGLSDPQDRLEAYKRTLAYRSNPRQFITQYALDTEQARTEIQAARKRLNEVSIPDETARIGLKIIHDLGIDSIRAEITLFEAARAHAAMDARSVVSPKDYLQVGVMALRLRRSTFLEAYHAQQEIEEAEIVNRLDENVSTKKHDELLMKRRHA